MRWTNANQWTLSTRINTARASIHSSRAYSSSWCELLHWTRPSSRRGSPIVGFSCWVKKSHKTGMECDYASSFLCTEQSRCCHPHRCPLFCIRIRLRRSTAPLEVLGVLAVPELKYVAIADRGYHSSKTTQAKKHNTLPQKVIGWPLKLLRSIIVDSMFSTQKAPKNHSCKYCEFWDKNLSGLTSMLTVFRMTTLIVVLASFSLSPFLPMVDFIQTIIPGASSKFIGVNKKVTRGCARYKLPPVSPQVSSSIRFSKSVTVPYIPLCLVCNIVQYVGSAIMCTNVSK